MKNSQIWEEGIVEAPWFYEEGGWYYLFYSGCGYNRDCYAVGVARSKSALGPYEKYENNPILKTRIPKTSETWEGPGHCSIIKTKNNKTVAFYHGWPRGKIGTKRLMLLD